MGHQHYSMTIDIYTHVTEAKYEEEMEKFGMAMDEGTEQDKDEFEDEVDESEDEEQGFGMMM